MSKLGNSIKNGFATAAKVGTAAITAAAAGVAALTKASLKNYAQYEQLVGGVDTLFKNASKKVQEYASNAYKTAGMSANEYMETVTSFSASLLQSLENDTEAAAEYANMAITDMSDNANKMGTDMEMIQNAYNGFAKQNYTMLDNLKLGYGGTKEEMERLLVDADKLSDSFNLQVDASGNLVYSYADIVDAIHIVQTEMGITGTTAKEAGTTIEGSVNSMKAAWTNLVTGLGDENADIGQLFDNLVVTIVGDGTDTNLGVLGTVIPRVKIIFEKLTGAIKDKLAEVDWKAEGEKIVNLISEGIDKAVDIVVQVQEKVDQTDWNAVGKKIGKAIADGLDLVEMIGEAIKNTDWEQLGRDMAQFLINSFQKNMRANILMWGGITGNEDAANASVNRLNQKVVQFSSNLGFDETMLTTDEGTMFYDNNKALSMSHTSSSGKTYGGGGGSFGTGGGVRDVNINIYGNTEQTLDQIQKGGQEAAAMLGAQ